MARHNAHHWYRIFELKTNKQKKVFRNSMLLIAIIEPAMTLPQIYEIWVKQEATGVSSATWLLFISSSFAWLFYGIQLRDKPLIISSLLWLITEVAVVIGTIIYS